ncbi:MAG: alpha-mannosidase [Clostridia bacterium]|nr:alpha-mannosidase [Clostridia bacterium]
MHYSYDKMNDIIRRATERLSKNVYSEIAKLSGTGYVTKEPVPFSEKTTGRMIDVSEGVKWGELWDCAWFFIEGKIPEGTDTENAALLIDVSGEGCVFDENGCPVRGITNVDSGFDMSLGKPVKIEVELDKATVKKGKVSLWLDCAMNDLFGNYCGDGKIKMMRLVTVNIDVKSLLYDFAVLSTLEKELDGADPRKLSIVYSLYDAACALGNGINAASVKKAASILARELRKKGGDPSLSISAIGHAHIDLAWLWPIRETKRKGARTFSTALANMELYPDYVFGASQPQLYEWMKELYPALYAKIKKRIAEGRWEPQGAMWVEADTNVSSGEALVRQLLYGKRFFMKEFGKDIKTLWLPDVFGYSAALPQLLKEAGVDYFMTIKLSWSEHNKFPHHTFTWEGIDGSSVLAHMPPEGTYNSAASPKSIKNAERNYSEKGVCPEALLLFGIGDGGGGPGEDHLERLSREKNLAGLPPVKQELSENFFKRIEKKQRKYPVWNGELYLEKHQGTYTTQARNKYYNRKCEFALAELEFASLLSGKYPKEEIDEMWKEILLYQFHDILPGSSIARVYEESVSRYREILAKAREMTEKAYSDAAKAYGFSGTVYANPTGFRRTENVVENGEWKKVSLAPFSMAKAYEAQFDVYASANKLENEKLKVRFNPKGQTLSIYDKRNRRELLSDTGNVFRLYNDESDAWDMKFTYRDDLCMELAACESEFYVDGAEACAKFTYKFGESEMICVAVLADGADRLDFRVYVDWHENFKMLRVFFPFDIHTSEACCNIQFGEIKRPTTKNTSWDNARFEICAQKYIDFRETGYGAALLNDCKYGVHAEGSQAELNLLRSTSYPGKDADRGEQFFTYSVMPHTNKMSVVEEAYRLNVPVTAFEAAKDYQESGIKEKRFALSYGGALIETVKKAEDSDDIILRAYEPVGGRANLHVNSYFGIKEVYECDLLENEREPVNVKDNAFTVSFRPFEIKTLKIKRG